AIDPASMMKNLSDSSSFVPKETVHDELFAAKANCRAYSISVDSKELMDYAKSVKGSPMSVLAVFCAKAMERVCPENTLPVSIMAPVSVRKVMGNTTSLLHQVVHAPYSFTAEDLKGLDDESLNAGYRKLLKGFSSEQNIRMLCGVYRGICEGYAKAFGAGALDNIILEQRAKSRVTTLVSYLGTLRTGEYGNRIRMTAYHAMPEKAIMLQAAEVGHSFYIDWYQGFGEDKYVKAMRDLMVEAGMESTFMERVE
nr:hypothetical protein [Lachnospiraceae bacterium]